MIVRAVGFRALLCAVGGLAATALPAQDTVTLKSVYHAGETDRYRTIFTIQGKDPKGADVKAEFTLVLAETARDVKPDGMVTIQAAIEAGVASLNGQEFPVPTAGQEATTTYDRDGRIVKQDAGQDRMGVLRIAGLARMSFRPNRPLASGHPVTFAVDTGAPGTAASADQKLSVTMTLLGREKPSTDVPVETYRVRTVADGAVNMGQGPQKIHIEAVSLLDPATGKAHRVEGEIQGIRLGAGDATMSFRRLRLPPDAKVGADVKPNGK